MTSLLETWYGTTPQNGEPVRKFIERREFYCVECGGFTLHAVSSVDKVVVSECLTCQETEKFVQKGSLGGLSEDTSPQELLLMLFGAETISKRINKEAEK